MHAPSEAAPTLRERLGGRWAISLRGYAILCAGVPVAIFSNEASATESAAFAAEWLAVALLGCIALGLYLLVLDRWTPYARRRVRTIPFWMLVLGTAGAGVVLAIAVSGGAALFGLPVTTTLANRVVGYIVIGEWLGLALILVLDGVDRSRRKRTALIERQVAMELATFQQTMLIAELRRQARAEVTNELRAAREGVDGRLEALSRQMAPAGDLDISDMLRSVANDEVRSLSARLWTTAARAYPRVRWWTVLVNTLRYEPLRPLALIAIHVVGNFDSLTTAYGTTTGLAMLAIVSVEVLVIGLVVNALMRRHPRQHVALFVAGALLMQAYLVPFALWRSSLDAGSGSLAWILTQGIAGLTLIFVASAVGSWWRILGSLERSYAQQLDQEQVEAIARSRAVAELARELARELHGSVQSKLVACAMVSERAVESGDVEQLKATLLEAKRVLDASLESIEKERPEVGIATEVHRKIALWDELCAIDVRIDPALADATAAGGLVGRVVEEGLANAIRHGGAQTIRVTVESVAGAIRIVIEDDGSGAPADVVHGLGSTVLNQATGGAWSLTRLDRGARLEAIVGSAGQPTAVG